MSNDLLKQLEDKINAAIETIEFSRMEITELKEQKEELENQATEIAEQARLINELMGRKDNED